MRIKIRKYKKKDKKLVKQLKQGRYSQQTEKMPCIITTCYLPVDYVNKVEEYIFEGRVPSKSEFIRNAVRNAILWEERILIPIKENCDTLTHNGKKCKIMSIDKWKEKLGLEKLELVEVEGEE